MHVCFQDQGSDFGGNHWKGQATHKVTEHSAIKHLRVPDTLPAGVCGLGLQLAPISPLQVGLLVSRNFLKQRIRRMLAGMTIDSFKLSEPWHLTNDEELVLFEHRGGSAIALVWQGSDVFFSLPWSTVRGSRLPNE